MKAKKFPEQDGKSTFGLHLMLDAYGVPSKPLDDMKLIYKFLNDLPDKIGMKRLTNPFVVNAEETASKFDPGGISGVVLIAESHISIHTFAKRGFFTFDIYSCSDFTDEIPTLLEAIKAYFPYKDHELQTVKRGLNYPLTNNED